MYPAQGYEAAMPHPAPAALSALLEAHAVGSLSSGWPVAPARLNGPHEADAELMGLGHGMTLAANTDGLGAEHSLGLIREAEGLGHLLVMGALSDLAAVGAEPLGLLLALGLPGSGLGEDGLPTRFAAELRQGIDAALREAQVGMLGGDLHEAAEFTATATALGLVREGKALTRLGLQAGDALWATGPLGSGNALATVRLMGLPEGLFDEAQHRPEARLAIGAAARAFAHAAIDTSDGALAALDLLARLHPGLGLELDFDLHRWCRPDAVAAMQRAGLPLWPLVGGEMGEYELILAVPPEQESHLLRIAPQAVRLGEVVPDPVGITLRFGGKSVPFDGAPLRNLAAGPQVDWKAYGQAFAAFGAQLGLP